MPDPHKIRRVLAEHIVALQRARRVLERSYKKCQGITLPFSLDDDEILEPVEALTSRFARAADILTQRIGKSIVAFVREDAPTPIDKAHVLEKIGAIESAEKLIAIRDVRNEIAHEYTEEGVQKVFEKCMQLVPQLFAMIDSVTRYADDVVRQEAGIRSKS